MIEMESDDRLLLPVVDSEIAGDLAVVLVGLPVALSPVVELGIQNPQPADQAGNGNLRPFMPLLDVVDDLVTGVVGNPGGPQGSPSSFFNLT